MKVNRVARLSFCYGQTTFSGGRSSTPLPIWKPFRAGNRLVDRALMASTLDRIPGDVAEIEIALDKPQECLGVE
ncbi:MAG: hypothetical protein KME17_07045 [Cyanosarcina radialis HA8281-LM2]|nr:hypothetical protein [Cyanosarcina radialis HA8281-LM2]